MSIPTVHQEYVGLSNKNSKEINNSWWTSPEAEMYQHVFAIANSIQERQSYRQTLNLRYARLYSNLELLGFAANSSPRSVYDSFVNNRVTYNLIQSCCDSAQAKIAKTKPKPLFLTSGGDFSQQQRGKKLTKYVEGVFYDSQFYDQAQKMFLDGSVFGTGFIKLYSDGTKICAERVIPSEIVVDEYDGMYGKPKQMYQVTMVDRTHLMELYPDHKNMIAAATSGVEGGSTSRVAQDLIKVTEAWKLPSAPDAKDGKHTICIENATLFSEDWDKTYFPFVTFRWRPRLAGYYGQGIPEQLIGTQLEINKILRNIQLAQHLVAVPRVIIDGNSKISTATMNNQIASILKVAGGSRDPKFFTPTAMNAEIYNHLKWLIQAGYEQIGISQLTASSKKPAGLDAAVALREYNEIETERFSIVAQQYEQAHLDAAKIIIDMSRDLYTQDKSLKVNVKGKDFIETIKWAEVDLPDEKFIMKSYPVSLLPSAPEGRLAKIQELAQAGMIDQATARALLDYPDLEANESLENANINAIAKDIESMIEEGKYNPPEPEMDLQLAKQKAQLAYVKARVDNTPEERSELILRYIDDLNRLIALASPPAPAAAAPLASPEPAPTSELLPNMPQ